MISGCIRRRSRSRAVAAGLALFVVSVATAFGAAGEARDVVVKGAVNERWDVPAGSSVATFLGKDQMEVATLVVNKAALLGLDVTIQSDAPQVTFSSGDSPKVVFDTKPAGPNGAKTQFKFVGGDQPTIVVNGTEDVRTRGKWIQMLKATAGELKMELTGATFATVSFPKPAGTPVAVEEPSSDDGPVDNGKKVTAQKLAAASSRFAEGVKSRCTRCSGEGKVTKSVKTGTYRDGNVVRPKYSKQTETCDKCNGKKTVRATDEVLNRLAASFLTTLSLLNEEDPKAQQTLSDTYKMITNSMIGDEKTWLLLTENGRSILSQRAPAAGTPVIAKATVKRSLPPQKGKRRYMVQIGGTDKMVLISDPVTADEVKDGPVLVGGLVVPADASKAEQKDAVAVLAQGFLVAPPVDKGWYWWYWWRK